MNYTALTNCPTRRVFAPMFKARWQNAQNIVNDDAYMRLIPSSYKTYYYAYIQQWLQWARGFVPMLHKQDFFSTGIGYTVCDVITKMCMSGGYRLHASDKATQDFIEDWCKDDLNNIFNKMFFFANAGGNALLCLTPVDGELYPSVIPIDRAVFQIGRKGDITSCTILNRFVAGESAYMAKETRVMRNGKAYWCVKVCDGGIVTSPTHGEWLPRVPMIISEQWRECYGDIQPNKWYEMPEKMRGIGVYNVKNKAVAVAIADMPGYSDSTLHTALDILYSIDYNYTMAQYDMYIGRSRTLVPKQMASRTVAGVPGTLTDGMAFREALEVRSNPLDDDFYTQVSDGTVDGKPIQPTFIQPDLRGDVHKFIRDADLELLASKIGISAGTLSSHLAGGGAKTDDQIDAETSVDEKTVGNKRGLASRAINAMLADVAHFYGFDCDDISIQWGRSMANSARENAELLADYNAGTLPLRAYLRRRWVDLDTSEIEKMAQAVEQRERDAFAFDRVTMEGEDATELAGIGD